jgi:hypothetical protein
MSGGIYSEDLAGNLRLVEALAPIHCTTCNGYHLARARKRLSAPEALDRAEIVGLIRGRVAQRETAGSFDILIAGSADTNLLATAAEAVSGAVQTRYTVLDHCQTPLAVCEAFARDHDLDLRTHQVDMGAPVETFAADVIVMHSLLRFLPRSLHGSSLLAMRRWLKPGGAIVFSHRLIGDARGTEPYYRAEYDEPEPILALFAETGLRVVSHQQHTEKTGPRRRLMAVLELI